MRLESEITGKNLEFDLFDQVPDYLKESIKFRKSSVYNTYLRILVSG